jgi:hypothetical protein
MRMPSSIATWCTILFFLFYALAVLLPGVPQTIAAVFALGVVVFTLIGR